MAGMALTQPRFLSGDKMVSRRILLGALGAGLAAPALAWAEGDDHAAPKPRPRAVARPAPRAAAVRSTVSDYPKPLETEPPEVFVNPDEALGRLKHGNAIFARGGASMALPSWARIQELSNGQRPFAVIVGCSDSRTAPDEFLVEEQALSVPVDPDVAEESPVAIGLADVAFEEDDRSGRGELGEKTRGFFVVALRCASITASLGSVDPDEPHDRFAAGSHDRQGVAVDDGADGGALEGERVLSRGRSDRAVAWSGCRRDRSVGCERRGGWRFRCRWVCRRCRRGARRKGQQEGEARQPTHRGHSQATINWSRGRRGRRCGSAAA